MTHPRTGGPLARVHEFITSLKVIVLDIGLLILLIVGIVRIVRSELGW